MRAHAIWAGLGIAALGAAWFGCTNDFDQFDPITSSSTGGAGNAGPGSGATGPGSGAGGSGASGGCTADFACDDSNACTNDTCNSSTGQCAHSNAADGPIPSAADAPNDCVNPYCVSGKVSTMPDDTESADDGNDCTTDSCSGGMKMNAPVAAGTPCAAGTCNDQGQCVGCTVADNCGVSDFCKQWSCDAMVCNSTNTPADTPLPDNQQTDGDCQQLACDGNGTSVSANADTDVPPGDGNPCTDEACAAGVPVHPPQPIGTLCGNGNVCDGAGNCIECNGDGDCNANELCINGTCVCQPVTCATLGQTCGPASDGCGAMLDCDDGTQNGGETDVDCGGGTMCKVKCSLGDTCNAAVDCTSGHCADGVCCNTDCTGACKACNLAASGGTCSNLPILTQDPPLCSGAMACADGGVCKKANGQTCNSSNECASNNCTGQPKTCQ